LIEIDGLRVLTDPAWSERSSPIDWIGPKRWFSPPIALDALPPIDAVVISHDHYDHLDHQTIAAMKDWKTTFVVPLGVGANLAYWGILPARIVELDWWEHKQLRGLDIACTPARHASGRTPFDKDQNLWAGYALLWPRHRVFFSGDTGLFPALRQIGERFGPFDATLIEIGQYHGAWPDWHIGPEQAVAAHRLLRGRVLLPVHWGKLQLAYHGWTEPIERVLTAATRAQVTVLTPMPGQSVEPEAPGRLTHWWPALPWHTAQEMPIVSTGIPENLLTDR
jgi:L-ascorbate metabolism protein UlaG (beta-lactamase superfamily)